MATQTDIAEAYILAVEGMTCQHCAARVEKAIHAVPGVEQASVDLESAHAHILGGKPHAVIAAIEEAGYTAKPAAETPPGCELVSPAETSSASTTAQGSGYRIDIDDMTCASCVARVEKAIRSVNGVNDASVNLVEGSAYIQGGEAQVVIDAIIDQGYPAHLPDEHPPRAFNLQFFTALTDPERSAIGTIIMSGSGDSAYEWVSDTQCRIIAGRHPADYLQALLESGYGVEIIELEENPYLVQEQQARRNQRLALKRALLAGSVGAGLMLGMMLGVMPQIDSQAPLLEINGRGFWLLMAIITLATMAYSGRNYYTGAWQQARHAQANMDTLVAVGTAAAWLASMLLILVPDFVPDSQRHLYLETSVLILAFLQFGHALEVRAKARTGRAIGALIELAPKTAQLLRNSGEITFPVSLLQTGDLIVVRPGEAIASDGTVTQGSANVDESMLSGESLPISKSVGDTVTGGSINQTGMLTVKITRIGEETTLAGIIQAVKRAQMSKPPIGRLVDKVAAAFVPIVLLIAVITFFSWHLGGPQPALPYALTTAIAVLVIACPCALGLATPIAIMVGMGRAAQMGILIRNGEALQAAAGITHLVVDKTGTLTEGRPRVTDIICIPEIEETQALTWAAGLEQASQHPLARAIVESAGARDLSIPAISDFISETGQGVSGRIDDRTLLLGRDEWLTARGIGIGPALKQVAGELAQAAVTPVFLADETRALAILGLRDPVRGDTPSAIARLQEQGIELVMCTGDHAETASAVADELGIKQVYSRVLPERKAEVIRRLQAKGYVVGMVGDGINDAPALTQANVGYAIGSGTDVAIQSADVTLANSSLASVATAVSLSKATLRNIYQNLFGAFIYNTLGIPLAAGLLYPFTGWLLSPIYASAAMALSSVTVVSNANRLRLFKPVKQS